MSRRRSLSASLRFAVLERCNFACFYCGVPAQQGLVTLQIEHVVPLASGGRDDGWNLVAACAPCNAGKGASAPTEAIVKAAQDLYFSSIGRARHVRLCDRCGRPWMPEWDDEEPMDECWPCVRAWVDGHYADRSWRNADPLDQA